LEAGVGYSLISSPVYFNRDAMPVQHNGEVSILAISLEKDIKLWLFHFDHRLLLQTSFGTKDANGDEILPVPLLSANLRYYLQGSLVKNVLTAQLGVDVYYNTEYYAYAYNPAAGAFHLQHENSKIGTTPYMDAFLNLKWKRATIFVKMINVAEGWPERSYFSTLHYIRPESVLKLGLSWFFF
jgi:hypothetical protein